jgi:hypothetical protein
LGDRSRGRFATHADFPPHDCSPYSHVHVRRESLGFVSLVQGPFPVAPCQTLASRFAAFSLPSHAPHGRRSRPRRCTWSRRRSTRRGRSAWTATRLSWPTRPPTPCAAGPGWPGHQTPALLWYVSTPCALVPPPGLKGCGLFFDSALAGGASDDGSHASPRGVIWSTGQTQNGVKTLYGVYPPSQAFIGGIWVLAQSLLARAGVNEFCI